MDAGIPTASHIGLTPHTIAMFGGFRIQGRTAEAAMKILEDALAIEDAGCFMLEFEAVPARIARLISEQLTIPTTISMTVTSCWYLRPSGPRFFSRKGNRSPCRRPRKSDSSASRGIGGSFSGDSSRKHRSRSQRRCLDFSPLQRKITHASAFLQDPPGGSDTSQAAMRFDAPLPIDAVLDELRAALAARACAVLVAPPGAGKTTRVPLALMEEGWLQGRKILVLEPRRIAARAAAQRMAHSLSEAVGGRVGLRARMVSKSGPGTRVEVVTEGVFTRMILDDPELNGIGAVLFDELHERSLDADLGLALALDCQRGFREELRIAAMSATLDGARVGQILGDAPVIVSEGRAFPVETRYLGRDPNTRIEDQMADAVMRALRTESGSILAFLPGQAEIRRVEERLAERIDDPAVVLAPLYGAMDMTAQDLALRPAPVGVRKVVLATSIAETSITIEGARVVVDSGLARVPRFEPDVGVTRLETVRVSRAAADQRRGRAGRTEPGLCYRLWDERQTQSLAAFAEPEIRSADLAGLLLDCADWGATDPRSLSWLDPPSAAAIDAAREELTRLEALDADGRITAVGRRLRSLPLPPRLARMVIAAAEFGHAKEAAEIAAAIVERGLGGNDVDLADRLERFRRDRSRRAGDMRRLAAGWARTAIAGRSAPVPHEEETFGRSAAGTRVPRAHRQGARRARPVPPGQRPRRQTRGDASLGAVALPGRGGAVGGSGVDAHPARGWRR